MLSDSALSLMLIAGLGLGGCRGGSAATTDGGATGGPPDGGSMTTADGGSTAMTDAAPVGCTPGSLPGLVDDGKSHPPPATGPYAYNSFVPSTTPGTSYVDPVFGSTVMRVTNDGDPDDLYARNMWWNADGTRYLHRNKNGTAYADYWDVIDVATGKVTNAHIPIGGLAADSGFDPVDPNVLYSVSPSGIDKITLHADGTWSTKTFFTPPSGEKIKSLGGTLNWIDAGGHYMVVRYGPEPSIHVYDLHNIAAGPYAGAVDGSHTVDIGSYVAITPDGKYLAGYDDDDWAVTASGQLPNMGAGVSWPLDHTNRSIGKPTHFWNLCGDHGTFISTSDGKDYMVTSACNDYPGIYRVDITWNAEGQSEMAQMSHNKLLLNWGWGLDMHMAAVARGPLQDWAFVSSEDGDDGFNAGTNDGNGFITPWKTYGQEIIAINVLTGEIRRLAHHRSRQGGSYYNQPRVSTSWGGEYVGWASNFNQMGVINTYAVPFGCAPSSAP